MKIYSSLTVFSTLDVEKTAEFYNKKLGFRRVDYLQSQEPHICLYRSSVEVILIQASNGQRAIPNRELYGYGEDAYFITDAQQELQDEFEAAGVEIIERVHITDCHNLEFSICDSDGRKIIFGMKQWLTVEDKIWQELYSRAKNLTDDKKLSDFIRVGGVAAAIMTDKGNIYTGVCIDAVSSLGMCAERNAMVNMITNGESKISKIVVVKENGTVDVPCKACHEYMMQLDRDSRNIEILVDAEMWKTVMLGDLTSYWCGDKQ